MNIMPEADLHTHTIASGHAFGTVMEMSAAAASQGLKMIALTDHGLNMPGGPHEYYFYKLLELPKVINGVEVLKGVEANIIDSNGNLDMPVGILENLDLVLAGFHCGTGYNGGNVDENTRAIIAALKNPFVHIITHPGNPQYPVDIEKVVMAAKVTGKILEINNSSFIFSRPGSSSRCKEFLRKAVRSGTLLALNSDAHSSFEVGIMKEAIAAVNSAGINPKQVINNSIVSVREYLRTSKEELKKSS